MVPVEESANVTVSGASPLVVSALKFATGTTTPAPATALVELPPFELKTTWLLAAPSVEGANLTTTFVEPLGDTLKEPPERMVKTPAATEAVPLSGEPPRLLTTRLACAVWPVS